MIDDTREAADSSSRFADDVRAGRRFAFGENWRRFLALVDAERILEAETSLRDLLDAGRLDGRTFLDVGSGSGLFSLAARRLGAGVVSFDDDPQCVACAAELRQRHCPDDPDWRIVRGSALDAGFLRSLGRFDIVYAWGVLHHTGDMWRALEHVARLPRPGGRLFLAIYNDGGRASRRWLRRKARYNRLPRALRLPYAWSVYAPTEAARLARYTVRGNVRGYVDQWRHDRTSRGMSRWHDMIDWIGGYPYEYASLDRLLAFCSTGFRVTRVVPGRGLGNHQIVLERL